MSDAGASWQIRDRLLSCRPALVMGIINVTPDSFSDGGRFSSTDAAVAHALHLAREGADLLDVGGESTRPGSAPVSVEEELRRVVPVVARLAELIALPISVDTSKAEVARQALQAGAHVINDVTALQGDADMAAVIRQAGAGVILMHLQGTPATMQQAPHYENVVREVVDFLQARLQASGEAGIAGSQVVLDPGIGFGKTVEHNLELLAELDQLQQLGRPICLGVSRKGLFGKVLGRPLEERLAGSLATACWALGRGAAQVLRVHDVGPTRDAVRLIHELRGRATQR